MQHESLGCYSCPCSLLLHVRLNYKVTSLHGVRPTHLRYFSFTMSNTQNISHQVYFGGVSLLRTVTPYSSRHVACGIRKTIKPSGKLETYSPNSQHHIVRGLKVLCMLYIANIHLQSYINFYLQNVSVQNQISV